MDSVVSQDAALSEVLERYWGYTSFRPLQRDAMGAILSGRDSIVVLPTGGGKSLCFQAPALVRDGLAVVVSPLISLMKDQVDTLVGNGVPAACYNSSLAPDRKSAVLAGLRSGTIRLIYVSPERLVGEGGESFRHLALILSRQFRGDRRSTLHQPVGTRLSSGVSAARAASHRVPRHQPPRLHRDRDRARASRHRGAARPGRTG